jgi:DNA repair protein SbcC/Rad50
MKILSVQMQGFGPFKETQSVDFSAFEDSGIFLIGGRTGAGKSTILDAICFALYGSVPRYDGYSGAMRLRSDHCEIDDVTEVTLIFEVDDELYRIVRNPDYDRPKSRGTGVTRQAAGVELAVQTGSGWEALETKIPEVARRVAEIVKLDKGQFLQVMLLAQNRFQEFLEADSKDRQSLLRTLFGTQRFEQYADALYARAQELGAELSRVSSDSTRAVGEIASELGVELPAEGEDELTWAERRVASSAGSLEAAQAAEAHAVKVAQAASEALTATTQLADRQRRRREAEQRFVDLEQRAAGHARAAKQRDAALLAAELRPRLVALDAATQELERTAAGQAAARELAGSLPDGELSEFVAGIVHTVGSLAQALKAESELAELERVDAAAAAALAAHHDATANIDVQRSALREQLQALAVAEGVAMVAAGDLPVAKAAIDAAERARAAAVALAAIELEVGSLREAELEALQARTRVSGEVDRLLAQQLHGRAALVAQTLVDGDPCAVCGAIEHPHPAQFDGEPVTDEEVATARTRFQSAAALADAASQALNLAEARAAEQRGKSGGQTLAELEAELECGRARLGLAQTAQTELEAIAGKRREIETGQGQLDQAERTAGDRGNTLTRDATLAAKALTDAQSLVDRARDGHQSVNLRVCALKDKQAALERVIAAQRALAAAETATRAAAEAFSAALAESSFPDRAAAEQAMLEPDRLESLVKAIRVYEDGVTQTRAVLEQADLQDLPAELANVAEASERKTEADRVRGERTEWRVRLDSKAKRASELTTQLKHELELSSELHAEFTVVDVLAKATRGETPNQLGIPLESFVLAAELEEIVAAANARLQTMSQGRYAIEHSDERTRGGKRTGLEIMIYDAHTGASRSPRSLSGGEKFLASLALALGMAEVVTNRAGGIQLDTLFIDEGFGALDNETLELAMHTLDELRQGGRTVGLISHVEAMKDQIPAKLLVGVADGGWSVIQQSA